MQREVPQEEPWVEENSFVADSVRWRQQQPPLLL